MVNEQRVVQEFMELVQVDSESRNERQMANILKQKLGTMGLTVVEDQAGQVVGTNTGNVIATLHGNPQITPVFFSAHMDTVQPGNGVKPILENGIIRSGGDTILGGDDKAGIAAILETLRIIQEQGIKHGDIQVVFTIIEEGGLLGAKNLDYGELTAPMGFVLDSGGKPGSLVVQGPAQDSLTVAVIGKSAHAGMSPEEGISAVQVAAKAIASMQLGRIDAETTANIGIIQGGKATNIIPDLVNLQGEARSLDEAKLVKQVQHMREAFETAAGEYGAQLHFNVERVYSGLNLTAQDQVVAIAMKAARELGWEPVLEPTGGGSDANVFNANGLPTVNLGVAMTKVHTTEETLAVQDLVDTVKFLVQIVRSIA